MIERFHGIDRHKAYSTISVLDREGREVSFFTCHDLRRYIEDLGPTDAVVLEASGGAFWWADRIEERQACCYVLNPYRFRIIKDSWNKTDSAHEWSLALQHGDLTLPGWVLARYGYDTTVAPLRHSSVRARVLPYEA